MAQRLHKVENEGGDISKRGKGRAMPRGRHRLTEEQHAEIRRHFRAAFTNSTPEQVFLKFARNEHGVHDRIRATDMLRGVRIHLRLPVAKLPDEDVLMLFLELDKSGREYLDVGMLVEYVNEGATKYDFKIGAAVEDGASACLRESRVRGNEKFGTVQAARDAAGSFGGVPPRILHTICARLKALSIQEYVWKRLDERKGAVAPDPSRPWLGPEASTIREAVFAHIDLNGDGKLSVEEFHDIIRHSLKVSVFELNDETIMHLVEALDTDRSGSISLDELHVLLLKGAAPARNPARRSEGVPRELLRVQRSAVASRTRFPRFRRDRPF